MNKLEKDLLFYSNYCLHSNNLINDLAKTPLHDKILYICIDDKKIKIPNFITRVPTVYLVKQRKVLIEHEIGEWVNFNLRQLSSNNNQSIPGNIQMPQMQQQMPQMQQQMPQMQQQMPQMQQQMPQMQQQMPQMQQQMPQMQQQMPQMQQQMPQQVQQSKKEEVVEEVLAYHDNEMGSDMSNSYSFIDEGGNTSLNHNFSFLDGFDSNISINTPKEFNGNNGEGGREVKKSQTDIAFDKLMEARNSDPISKGIQRI
jgi:hypothetical protein